MTLLAAAEKVHVDGTHRTVEPARTLDRLHPVLPAIGVTRVAVITGLDVIGIPVVMVCRPNGRSLSVSQGKGVDLDRRQGVGDHGGRRGLARGARAASAPARAPTASCARLPGSSTSSSFRDRPGRGSTQISPSCGSRARTCSARERVWVPYECVHLDFRSPGPQGSGCFLANGTGLAAGNHMLEAVSHALCEVVERDAFALWGDRTPADRASRQVDLDDRRRSGLPEADRRLRGGRRRRRRLGPHDRRRAARLLGDDRRPPRRPRAAPPRRHGGRLPPGPGRLRCPVR